MRLLRELGVESNLIGWYQSTYLGSYCTRDTVDTQFEFQNEIPHSVLVIYDNVKTTQGHLSLKAYRLTESFMESYRSLKAAQAKAAATGTSVLGDAAAMNLVSSLSPSAIFEEVPLRFRNGALIQAFVTDLIESKSVLTVSKQAAAANATNAISVGGGLMGVAEDMDLTRLDLNASAVLEKHLKLTADVTVEMLTTINDQTQYQRRLDDQKRRQAEFIAARKAENELRRTAGQEALPEHDPTLPIFQPLRDAHGRGSKDPLEAVLMQAQISNYSAQAARIAGSSFGKLFLTQTLHKQ